MKKKLGEEEHLSLLEKLSDLKSMVNPADIRLKFEDINVKIERINQRITAFGESENLRKEVEWLSEELKKLSVKLGRVQEELERKVDYDKLRDLLGGLSPRDELLSAPAAGVDSRELDNLRDKFNEQLHAIEKKLERVGKTGDLKGLLSQLKLKADEEPTRTELSNHDFKLSTLERSVMEIMQEIESLKMSIQRIMAMVSEAGNSNSLVSRRHAAPNICLSCGRGDARFAPLLPQVIGSDGRIYKADGNLLKLQPGGAVPVTEFEPVYDLGAEVFSMDTHEQAHFRVEDEQRSFKLPSASSPGVTRSQNMRGKVDVVVVWSTRNVDRKVLSSSVSKARPQSAKK